MKTMKLTEMMTPLAEFPTVRKDATLYEIMVSIETSHQKTSGKHLPSYDVIVLDEDQLPVGKINPMDLLSGLEDGYQKIGDIKGLAHFAFTPEFLRSTMRHFDLWQEPLADLCTKAVQKKASVFMRVLKPIEFMNEESSLDEAAHRMIIGNFGILVVTRNGKAVGVLRMEDVVAKTCETIKACAV
jgi:hypothetical protein